MQTKSYFRKPLVLLLLIVAVTMMACNQAEQPTASSNLVSATSAMPEALRSLPVQSLSVKLTINGSEQTYSGTEFTDGQWLIPVDLIPGKSYPIQLDWFSDTYLLMVESGEIVADPTNPTVKPQLDFVTSGNRRFDDDCDGSSNLSELYAGTNPGFAENNAPDTCETDFIPTEFELTKAVIPGIIKVYNLFIDDNINQPVVHISQPMQVRSVNPNVASAYTLALSAQGNVFSSGITAAVSMEFHPEFGAAVRFQITGVADLQGVGIDDDSCTALVDSKGVVCRIAYDWQVSQWYELGMEEVAPLVWEGAITDANTGVRETVALITLTADVAWERPAVGMSFQDTLTNQDCVQGLSPTTLQYTVASVNNTFSPTVWPPIVSPCLRVGDAWNESVRQVDNEFFYSLTVGK